VHDAVDSSQNEQEPLSEIEDKIKNFKKPSVFKVTSTGLVTINFSEEKIDETILAQIKA